MCLYLYACLSLAVAYNCTVINAYTAYDISPYVFCYDYDYDPSFRNYETNEVLETKGTFCEIDSPDMDAEFNVSTPISLQYDIFSRQTNDKEHVLNIHLNCTRRAMVYFSDYSYSMNYSLLIGYLYTNNCDIFWNDIEKLGSVVDLRSVYMEDNYASFESELELGYFPKRYSNGTMLSTLPMGLLNVGYIILECNTQRNSLSAIFTDFLWPVMGELVINNHEILFDLDELRLSMPVLQTIHINNCALTSPLWHFPWSKNYLELPRNIIRENEYKYNDYMYKKLFLYPLTITRNRYERIADYRYNNISGIDNFTFTGRLDALILESNYIETISSFTFNQIERLQFLDISNNKLSYLPFQAFKDLSQLKYLHLEGNALKQIQTEIFFNNPSLLYLNVSNNMVETVEQNSFQELNNLHILDLSHNNINALAHTPFSGKDIVNIREIHLSSNRITLLPTWLYLLKYASVIDVSNNPVTWSSFIESLSDMNETTFVINNMLIPQGVCFQPFGQTKRLIMRHFLNFTTINLNEISFIEIEKLLLLLKCYEVELDGSALNCDCNVYKFYSALHRINDMAAEGFKTTLSFMKTAFKCNEPQVFHGQPLFSLDRNDFRCVKHSQECLKQCTCYFKPSNNQTIVDCISSNLTSLPSKVPNNTYKLLVSGNYLTDLKFENRSYLKTLTYLDVSGNMLTHVESTLPGALSSLKVLNMHNNRLSTLPREVSEFRDIELTLGGNPWTCDCNTKWMKDWIMSRRHFIDIDDVICATGEGQGKAMVDVPSEMFVCLHNEPEAIKISLIALSVIAVVLIITIVLIYKYRGEIKVLLYVHFNWHPFDRTPEADVLDNDYDVFISYSSYDFPFARTILDFLESQNPPFKVCLHDRDFLVGAPIQDNIMESVRRSRRMIMILTNNYLDSDWCTLEFRAAHDRVLNDHTNYLILVLADDIPDEKLDDDLKLYIHTNTYLSFGNKWFYDKLRYVLPQVPLSELEATNAFLTNSNVSYNGHIDIPETVLI